MEGESLASAVQQILPQYEALQDIDRDAVNSQQKFTQFIARYAGTVTGQVLTQEMDDILCNILSADHEKSSYAMVCLSDKYRSGELADDEYQSAESKWLLSAALQGYIPAIEQMAEAFAIGTPYFERNQTIANALTQLIKF
jgi:hypothetical protein